MKYTIFLMSDLSGADPANEGKLYLAKDGNSIRYKTYLNSNVYEGVIEQSELEIPDDQFEQLNNDAIGPWESIKENILKVTSKRGHTFCIDHLIEEADCCVSEILENADPELFEGLADMLGLVAVLKAKLTIVRNLVKSIKQLDKLTYLADHLELLYRYHENKGNSEKLALTDGDLYQDIIAKIKPDQKEAAQKALQKMEDSDNQLRKIYQDKLQALRATKIHDDEPTENEIMMLYNTLCMMMYSEDADISDPIFQLAVKPICPVYKSINGLLGILRNVNKLSEFLNQPNVDPDARDRLYYPFKKFKGVNAEKLLSSAITALWDAVTKVKINNIQRDEAHARMIVERLAHIQDMILNKQLQPILNQIYNEQCEELRVKGFDQVQVELLSLRDGFKSYILEADHVSLFSSQSELPFYKRIDDTIILLKRLKRLMNPDLVTPGDQLAAQEKFKDLIEIPRVLAIYREELESIRSKIKKEHQDEAELKLQRMIVIVQYAASEMKGCLNDIKQKNDERALLGDRLDALEYKPGASLALRM